MDEVKNIMNDIYLTYKQYKVSGDVRQWTDKMSELRKKYSNSTFFENLAVTFAEQIGRELGH